MRQIHNVSTPPARPEGELARVIAEERFTRLYNDYGRDVLAYALPRAAKPEDAADIVAETFLVAWRRAGDVPPGSQARLWLFGVARGVLANQRRGDLRRSRLSDRLRAELPQAVAAQPERDDNGALVLSALARLGPEDREVLLLAGWEQLRSAEIARVLDISTVAARTRLHRARRRLRRQLAVKEDGVAVACSGELELDLEEAR